MAALNPLQEAWLKELESGNHAQCKKELFNGEGYCCLGIAEKFVFHREFIKRSQNSFAYETADEGRYATMSENDYKSLGLLSEIGTINNLYKYEFKEALLAEGYRFEIRQSLAGYNDLGVTFKQLAAAIRKVPQAVFIDYEKQPFSKLTKSEQRVAIAKDALAQLNVGKYVPRTGIYFKDASLYDSFIEHDQNDFKGEFQCRVCQIGALLVSGIRLNNHCTVFDNASADNVFLSISRWFSQTQIVLIEAAFEVSYAPPMSKRISVRLKDKDISSAHDFGNKFASSFNRMKAILKNIIQNKGLFVP